MLTKEKLINMLPGEIFLQGETTDSPEGINIWTKGTPIYWVAVRGEGFHDWAVYTVGDWNIDSVILSKITIASQGDKCPKRFVRNIVDCDDEALELYRQ